MLKRWLLMLVFLLTLVLIGTAYVNEKANNTETDKNIENPKKGEFTAQQAQAAVQDLLNKISTIEAAKDTDGFKNLFTKDTKEDVSELIPSWDKMEAKTTFLANSIKKFTEKEIIVVVKQEIAKISGGFFANSRSLNRYILHLENGQWKIYDISNLHVEFANPDKLFDQAISVPKETNSAIEKLLISQNKALNTDDEEAYMALIYFIDDAHRKGILSQLPGYFNDVSDTTIKKWEFVEYTDPDQAIVLISVAQNISTIGGKVPAIYSSHFVNVDGKWMFTGYAENYSTGVIK